MTQEIAQGLGISEKRVREALKILIKSGKVKCVRRTIMTIAGTYTSVPAYLLSEEQG